MLYALGVVALIFIIYGLILFIKRGNKEFDAKLSLKERTELEKMLERQAKEEAEEELREKEEREIKKPGEVTPKVKPVFPSKDLRSEIARYTTHLDINNTKVQHSIRNGVESFLNLDYNVALEEFSLAIEMNPKDTTGFFCRGLAKLQLKNFESAISDFTEAINLKIKEPNAFYYRALCYFNLRDIENAILNLNNYIGIESESSEAYFDLAVCLKQKESINDAIKYFSIAVEKDPGNKSAYFERGLLRHKLNDLEGCCADLKKALEMGHLEAYDHINKLCKDRKDLG